VCILILLVDLFLYGFISVKGNYESFDSLKSDSKILQVIQKDQGNYRIYCFIPEPHLRAGDQYPTFPNYNMFLGLDHVGIYSPLAFKKYKQYFAELGAVNDSLYFAPADLESLQNQREKLNFLNVKYLLTQEKLPKEFQFSLLLEEEGVYLYENKEVLPRYYFNAQWEGVESDVVKKGSVEILEQSSKEIKLEVEAPKSGQLITSNLNYPGWKVWVDGREVPIGSVEDLFQAVPLIPGKHHVVFKYTINHFIWAFWVSGFCLMVVLFGIFYSIFAYRRKGLNG